MQQTRNHLIFFLAVLLLFLAYVQFGHYVFPQKKVDEPVAKNDDKDKPPKPDEKKDRPRKDGPVRLAAMPEPTREGELITLGSSDADSEFNLLVQLDPLGGGVRQVLLNKFQAADDDGRPVRDKQLELVPDEFNRQIPAFMLYHFDVTDPNAAEPLDSLGRVRWEVVKVDGKAIKSEGKTQQVAFRRTVQGVTLTKTFMLTEGDYHLGLRVDMQRAALDKNAGEKEKKALKFRYQLAGARGLPVEGKWYTSVFRNAYIGKETPTGGFVRALNELRQITLWGGGGNVDRDDGGAIRYAGVAVQYFASVIAVDDQQTNRDFLKRARATLETAVARGRVKTAVKPGDDRIVIVSDDPKVPDATIYLPADMRDQELLPGPSPVAVIYRSMSYDPVLREYPRVAVAVRTGDAAQGTHAQWEDDITMRVNTDVVELEPGQAESHSYVLYHGPVKPSLLKYLKGDRQVDAGLIDRYANTLHLNTMTDYATDWFPFGWIGKHTGFSWLVMWCTNMLHRVLGWLTWVVPSYGICILILTIMVRGLMFPLSRKQAMMGIKMQALAPEMKALAAKHADDPAARQQAQMELFRKHGVNPLGSCWIMLLQMPIFMGLYYALQESIQFRLAPFWPTWIVNLAAPDMMIYWTRSIPLLSSDASYGGMLYLGPYLNLLPIIAVALMMIQQQMMTPPPADEQQEMQQKMMKYMMIVMCLMFYKVAAGLCIYFIASSLWGFAERQLLPKAKKPGEGGTADPVSADRPAAQTGITTAPTQTGITPAAQQTGVTKKKPGRIKRKDRQKEKEKAKEEPTSNLGKLRQRVSDWWNDVLEQARKK